MSNKKITELTEVTTANADDVLAIVNDGKTKKIKKSNLVAGVSVETPTGTVNGVNVTFTVSNTPKFVVIDGAIRFAGAGYSYASGTITVDSLAPPVDYIRSIY
jgi:phosphatidylserine/phosphatidylglycerophosphate/cardiolipin synthase-like enzyme